jgi:hypothetical protein
MYSAIRLAPNKEPSWELGLEVHRERNRVRTLESVERPHWLVTAETDLGCQ